MKIIQRLIRYAVGYKGNGNRRIYIQNFEEFCYQGIDVPFVFERYDVKSQKLSISFNYCEDHEIKPINEENFPETFKQMKNIYKKAVELKRQGVDFDVAVNSILNVNENPNIQNH